MAPLLNSQDDRAAFLDACITERRQVYDAWESLGLISQTIDCRKGYFIKNEANELQEKIEQIAKSFATSYHADRRQLQYDLAEETVFGEDVMRLGQQYGARLWGRLEDGEIRSSGESQGRGIDEHDWDVLHDRKNILFFIRCWVISVVVREYRASPRKTRGKSRALESGPSENHYNRNEIAYLSDSASSETTNVPFRAPEPPRMFATPEPQREAPLATDTTGRRFNACINPKIAITAPTYSDTTTPERLLFKTQRQRESTHDTDATWIPRETTAETETVVGGDEVTPGEVDSILQSAIAGANEDNMQYEYHNQSAAGPSGTYRNPLRQDSVIPNDTQQQNGTAQADVERTDGQGNISNSAMSGALSNALERSLMTHPSDSASWQQRKYRRELFKLLVSYLNGIEQFSSENYDFTAEERMNFLLNQFWAGGDTEALHTKLGSDNATRIQIALESWMNMRHRLSEFRSATGYFGRPGEQWTQFLRSTDDAPCAQAMIAFVDLQDFVESGDWRYVRV
ncbi:conserved hypothetical protein [Pyrenophora tritici-repentis Pt-1C-BFP]|uniref:Uncharacterized protein n=1 Tax=Pyrenophora tritici-repentis (strain Pt-1C-BFP) TaxID=426418 RepID=B2VSX2_PYRTR|nr:uncharacterized protein PTRG_00756 [Pyrenophora tritici-repentis Pt-1C-BFP]EDU40194.1 conserved hypothetical protein [Pyrenophora tritici-repentis Pt-1C-BFP]